MKTNNHKKEKKRPLSVGEKSLILVEFLNQNGQISHDALLKIKSHMPGISIFQVTGWVVCLHSRVREGLLPIRDFGAYEEFMRDRRMEWATWNSPKYNNLRNQMVLRGMK